MQMYVGCVVGTGIRTSFKSFLYREGSGASDMNLSYVGQSV
jgi:hypothetical protein